MKIKVKATVIELIEIDDNDGKPGAVLRLKAHPAHLRELSKLLYREVDAEIEFTVTP